MPNHVQAWSAVDAAEEGIVRQLAASRHGPADVIRRARIVVKSWEGKPTQTIADELDCHPKTVRMRVAHSGFEMDRNSP
jgi:DNA-binding CsgD family transcriptional regulator